MEQMISAGIYTWLLLWMGVWSYEDIRKRSLPLWQLLLVLAAGAAARGVQGQLLTADVAAGIGIGGILALVSVISGGHLGSGDAWVAGICGLYVGGRLCLIIVAGGLAMASVYGIYLLIGKKRSGKTAIPLVPFLGAAYLVCWAGVCPPLIP